MGVTKLALRTNFQQRHLSFLLGVIGVSILATVSLMSEHSSAASMRSVSALGSNNFIASIDTMKESRDTESWQEPYSQITQDVNLIATLNVNYITIDTNWEYPAYMAEWVRAIRATGKHVWFRGAPNQWTDQNGTTGIMTPAAFESEEAQFITSNPTLFEPGDIFDPCAEPEDGSYWSIFPANWSWQGAPNQYTDAFNAFILDTTTMANQSFAAIGVKGVITTIHSTNSWWAENPNSLYNSTIRALGVVTIDSYPERDTTDPATAAAARVSELNAVHAARPGVPVVIGEMGYSNDMPVTDAQQQAVLQAEFSAIEGLNYVAGTNYWVGPGSDQSGGYTHIFAGQRESWTLRPAASNLAAFFQYEESENAGPTPTPTPTPTRPQPRRQVLRSLSQNVSTLVASPTNALDVSTNIGKQQVTLTWPTVTPPGALTKRQVHPLNETWVGSPSQR